MFNKNTFTQLKLPAIIGSILVLPFILLELINRQGFGEDFPLALFGILWLLPVAFFLTLLPIVQGVRAGDNVTARPLGPLLSVTLLILVTLLWVAIIQDQMPCFLGVPNCD